MVRTKAGSVSTKAVGAKAPAKVAITAILSGNGPKVRNHGNSYHPRDTPGWQKPITFFMKQEAESSKDDSKNDEEIDERPGRKRPKLEAGASNDDSNAEDSEEEIGIPGIPASSSTSKILDTKDAAIDRQEERNIKGKKTLMVKEKERAKGKKTMGKIMDRKKASRDDMDLEKQEDDSDRDEKYEEKNKKVESMDAVEEVESDDRMDTSKDGLEGTGINEDNEDNENNESNEDTEGKEMSKGKSIDATEDKVVAGENNEIDKSMDSNQDKAVENESNKRYESMDDKEYKAVKEESTDDLEEKVVNEEYKENNGNNTVKSENL